MNKVCSAPFKALHIRTDGNYAFCCVGSYEYNESVNGKNLVDIRKTIISGGVPKLCQSRCIDHQDMYYTVGQNITNQFPVKVTTEFVEELNLDSIEYIDARLSNICNFMCIMCDKRSSHLWGKHLNVPNPYVSWDGKEDQIIETIVKCKNLKTIALAGGEPFFNKPLLMKICAIVPKSCKLKIITNASIYDEEIVEVMNTFSSGKLNCSIDGTGSYIEAQRTNAVWHEIESNMMKFSSTLHDAWDINLIPTFTSKNIHGIPDLLDWYFNVFKSARPSGNFYYTFVVDRPELIAYHVPLSERKKIVDECISRGYPENKHISALYESLLMDK
jgi:hypothetical protein